MKLTEKLIQALITEEKRVIFKTTYDNVPCVVEIGDLYLVVKFNDGVMLQQDETEIVKGTCFEYGDVNMYTSIGDAHIIVKAKMFMDRFGDLEIK
jgi:hypothetical protein